jgi:hypothetical protein
MGRHLASLIPISLSANEVIFSMPNIKLSFPLRTHFYKEPQGREKSAEYSKRFV